MLDFCVLCQEICFVFLQKTVWSVLQKRWCWECAYSWADLGWGFSPWMYGFTNHVLFKILVCNRGENWKYIMMLITDLLIKKWKKCILYTFHQVSSSLMGTYEEMIHNICEICGRFNWTERKSLGDISRMNAAWMYKQFKYIQLLLNWHH